MRWRLLLMGGAACAALVAAFLVVVNDGADDDPGQGGASVDVCGLLTDAEIVAIVGVEPGETTADTEVGGVGDFCTWDSSPPDLDHRVVLWVEPAAGFGEGRRVAQARAHADPETSFDEVAIGDAGWIQNLEGGWLLEARVAERMFRLSARGERDAVLAGASAVAARLQARKGESATRSAVDGTVEGAGL